MKNILIAVLFNCSVCQAQIGGQRMDTILRMMQDSGLATYSIGNPYGGTAINWSDNPDSVFVIYNTEILYAAGLTLHSTDDGWKYKTFTSTKHRTDTQRIVMLVADTAHTRPMNFLKEPAVIGGVEYSLRPPVYWTFGYDVLKRKRWFRKHRKHLHFLDIHKKRLTENIIVWKIIK